MVPTSVEEFRQIPKPLHASRVQELQEPFIANRWNSQKFGRPDFVEDEMGRNPYLAHFEHQNEEFGYPGNKVMLDL